jgi:hypothetical protein
MVLRRTIGMVQGTIGIVLWRMSGIV